MFPANLMKTYTCSVCVVHMYWLKYSVVSNTVIVKADTATVEN